MISKFAGKCKTCGKPYNQGAEIYWSREDGAHHFDCWDNKAKDLFSDAEASDLADRCLFIPAASIGEGFQIPAGWLLWKLHETNRSPAAGRPQPETYF